MKNGAGGNGAPVPGDANAREASAGARERAANVRPPLADTARTAGLGLVAFGVAQLAAAMLAQNATGAAAVQAVIAEFGAARIGVAWTSAPAPPLALAIRLLRGAALGFATALTIAAIAIATHGAHASWSTAAAAQIVLGLIVASLTALRDELLLRGILLRAFLPAVPRPVALAICGVAAAAAHYGAGGGTVTELVAVGFGGAALAAMWIKDGGVWLPWGANAMFHLTIGPLLHGGVAEAVSDGGTWGGTGELDTGLAGAVVLAAAAAAAYAWAARRDRPHRV